MELAKKSDVQTFIEAIKENDGAYEIKVEHDFHGGMYMRTFYPKKGSVVVGKLHKKDGYGVLLSGKLIIGGEFLAAPHVFNTAANSRNIGYFTEDSVFASFDVCSSDNVDDAELEMFWADDVMEDDYEVMLSRNGLNEDIVQHYTHLDNIIDDFKDCFNIEDSNIDGKGCFSKRCYVAGDKIGMSLIDGKRTVLGRWVNHSNTPNCKIEYTDYNNINVYAIKDIQEGSELLFDYEQNILNLKEIECQQQ